MTGINKTKHGWLRNPKQPREGEVIGGGFFVFRRGDSTNRIRPSMWPYEHGTRESAEKMAAAHAQQFPGYRFDVVQVVGSHLSEASDGMAVDPPADPGLCEC